MAKTLYEKIFSEHVVHDHGNGEFLLYIDLHLIHEVSSPQAFSGLRQRGLPVRRPELVLAVADHNIPTTGQDAGVAAVADENARAQLEAMDVNVRAWGIEYYGMGHARNGIVHVVAPEVGRTQPGMTIVCGDSHTSTHGAFGTLAFGIGTSEVEHVLATQTLRTRRSKTMRVKINGELEFGSQAKDLALALIATIGTAGGTGHVIEYQGRAIDAMAMSARMTLCNMTIEAGARAGLIAPDTTTITFLRKALASRDLVTTPEQEKRWLSWHSDEDAIFDKDIILEAASVAPFVTWGTSPEQAVAITGTVPTADMVPFDRRGSFEQALDYMGLIAGQPIQDIALDYIFIGSCTNSRIEDLEAAAAVLRGRKINPGLRALAVPGSIRVRQEAESRGLDRVFIDAGFEWREPGCSMCLGMNNDRLEPGQRCASTSNRNFEGRQGRGGRTHLVSPMTAAASALTGKLTDPRPYIQ